MKKLFLALLLRSKQSMCHHTCSVNDLEADAPNTDPNRVVSAPCRKCGKVLKAAFGLALPCAWTQEPKT